MAFDPYEEDMMDQVSIYLAPADCSEPDEDGELILIATEIPIEDDRNPSDYGVDAWVDYVMRPPRLQS